MIQYYKTINGRVRPLEEMEDGCWINVINPDEKEINGLIQEFSLEPDFLRAALDEEESSRIESEDDNTLIILDAPVAEKNGDSISYYTLPIGILVTQSHVITVCLRENPIIAEFIEGVVKGVQTELRTQFVLHLMLRVATRFLQFLKQIDKLSSSLEKQLRKSMKNKELIQLLDVQKSLVYFSTSLKADETTLEKLMRGRYIKLYEDDQDLLEDVLGWVAVLIGSVIIRYTGWYFIDPLLSVGIGVFILTNVCRNLYTIFRILLQAAPEHMPEDKIKAILQEVPNVKDVHDLHVWTLDGERNIASAHLIVADDISRADAIRVKHDAVDRLKEVGIDHLTVEVEFEGEGCYSCPVE